MSFPFGGLRLNRLNRHSIWAITIFLLLCHYMLLPANIYHIETSYNTYYICAVPVLFAAVLYYRHFRDGLEYKLLFAFWVWFWFSRALNGCPLLDRDFRIFFDLSLMIPFFAFGAALSKDMRSRFLDWMSTVIGGFYFIIGLIALVAFLRRTMYHIPVLNGDIGIIREAGYARIYFFDNHPNTAGYWYLISLYLMIYQFFHCKKKLWRIPILLSAALDLIIIAISYSRSARLCMAMTFALLAAVLVQQLLRQKSLFLRGAAVLFSAGLVLVAAYEGSGLCADVMATLSYEITDLRPASETTEQPADQETAVWADGRHAVRPVPLSSGKRGGQEAVNMRNGLVQSDPRPKSGDLNDLSSNRIAIYRAAIQAIGVDPSVLWKGQLTDDVMTITQSIMGPNVPGGPPINVHNSLLQILMTTGIPGLLLATVFLILVSYKGLCLLFSRQFPLDVRMLVLPVLTVLPRVMTEAYLFTSINIRTLFFFLMCGMTIGLAKDSRSLIARTST